MKLTGIALFPFRPETLQIDRNQDLDPAMRFTVPFLLAIAVFTATVLGANQTSFTPNEDMLYDIVSASDAIAFRLERAIGVAEQPALFLGALLLTIPALLTFHLFRIGFGGSVQSLIQEERLSRQMANEREQAAAARYATAHGATGGATSTRARDGEVLSRSRAGDTARVADSDREERRSSKGERRSGTDRRRGLKANLAAALSGRTRGKTAGVEHDTSSSERPLSGTTSLSAGGANEAGKNSGIKDRWSGILENKPDFSRLKTGAQSLKERISSRPGSTKLSLDDIADDVEKS